MGDIVEQRLDVVEQCDEVVKQCKTSFEKYPYPIKDVKTMYPATFKYNYDCSVKDIPDCSKGNNKGDNAEKLVFDALESSREPMLVIRSLKFNNFLEPFLKYFLELPDGNTYGEVDFVIFHWKIGVFILEVKAQHSDYNKRKAKEQLDKSEKIIKELLETLKFYCSRTQVSNLPIYKVYATPNHNLTDKDILSDCLQKKNLGNTRDWFNHFHENESNLQEEHHKVFLELCYVLFGQKTVVSIPEQKLFQFSSHLHPRNIRKRTRTCLANQQSKVPRKERKKNFVTINEDEPLRLETFIKRCNGEQQAVWDRRHQVIRGVTGSGKTVLLLHKALECVKNKDRVKICVDPELIPLYKDFFKKKKIGEELVSYVSMVKFSKFLECESWDYHFFCDEFQLFFVGKTNSFPTNLSLDPKKYFWVALDEMQVGGLVQVAMPEGQYGGSELAKKVEKWLVDMEDVHRFHISNMATSMRFTNKIHEFIQEYIKARGVTLAAHYQSMKNIGHQIPGESVTIYVYERANGDLPINMSNVTNIPYEEEQDLSVHCANKLVEVMELDVTCPPCVSNSSYAVLVHDPTMWCAVRAALDKYGITFSKNDELLFDDGVVVAMPANVNSYEWETVFVICKPENFNTNFIAFTRAICKLVVMFY